MKEEWRSVVGFNGAYQVSNFGRVRSLDRVICRPPSGEVKIRGRTLRGSPSNHGYPRVSLTQPGRKRKEKTVHRLVAQAFLSSVAGKPCINHKDGDKKNNVVSNLEWCTHAENMHHAGRVLEVLAGRSGPGEQSPAAKLKETEVRVIKRRLINGETPAVIAQDYPVGSTAISEIRAGRSWRHVLPHPDDLGRDDMGRAA